MTPRTSERGNNLKLYPQRAKTAIRKNSFALRVVKYWNSLPDVVVTSPSLNAFKNRLDKYWEKQDIVYEDFKADILLDGSDVNLKDLEHVGNTDMIESGIEEPSAPALENNDR